jgi:uncharacterized membrane protein
MVVVTDVLFAITSFILVIAGVLLIRKYGLKVEDIPRQPEKFIDILRTVFGSGGFAMENIIVKHLSTNTGVRKRRLSEMVTEISGRR